MINERINNNGGNAEPIAKELYLIDQQQRYHKSNNGEDATADNDNEYQTLLTQLPPEYSEGEVSERFTAQYADTVKFVEAEGCWMHWTGQVWERLDAFAFEYARKTVRQAACELKKEGKNQAALIVYSNRFVG